MMNGDATWKTPSAAVPLIRVRRLNFPVKVGDVMSFLLGNSSSSWSLPRRRQAPASYRPASGRPLYLAAGSLRRTGGLFAGHRVAHREHVVRIALRRMGFADEYGAHQFMVSGAIFRRAGLQRDLGRQLESGKRARQLRSLERLLLIGNHRQRLHRSI